MKLTPDQIEEPLMFEFEKYPDLAIRIQRMASTGRVGNVLEWSDFVASLDSALKAEAIEAHEVGLNKLKSERDTLLAAMEQYLPYIPNSTAKDGGASKHSAMVHAADAFRDAIAKVVKE